MEAVAVAGNRLKGRGMRPPAQRAYTIVIAHRSVSVRPSFTVLTSDKA